MEKKESEVSNSLLDSLAYIKKLELLSESMIAHDALQKEYGEVFDEQMEMIVKEIIALQAEAIEGTTFFMAGLLLSIAPPEEGDDVSPEDFQHFTRMVKAAIHWGGLKGYK